MPPCARQGTSQGFPRRHAHRQDGRTEITSIRSPVIFGFEAHLREGGSAPESPAIAGFSDVSHHSHSMVPGGFPVMSYTTRLTPRTSLMMRLVVFFSTA